jgi:DNA-binding transcriptional MerR regulator
MQGEFRLIFENSGDSMKTGEVAKRFHLDSNTVTAWTGRFAEFFTPEALAKDKTQRDYQPEDIIVLNTIRVERIKNTKWDEILEVLKSDRREEELPADFATVEGANAVAVLTKIYSQDTLLATANAEIVRLREELAAERKEKEALIKDAADAERLREADAEKQRRIDELNREVGEIERLREAFAALDTERKEKDKRIEELVIQSTKLQAHYEFLKEKLEAKEKPSDA